YSPARQYPAGTQAPQMGAQGTAPGSPGYPGGQALWTGEQRSYNKLLFTVVMCVVGGAALLVALGYIALATGVSRTSVAFVLALVPLAIVLLGVRWLDRWEPEPKPILAVALVWGAGVAVLSALIVNTTVQQWLLQRSQDPESTAVTTAVFVAPVVEETVKGAGVVLLYIFRRRHMDGPVDGVVFAATVAAYTTPSTGPSMFRRCGAAVHLPPPAHGRAGGRRGVRGHGGCRVRFHRERALLRPVQLRGGAGVPDARRLLPVRPRPVHQLHRHRGGDRRPVPLPRHSGADAALGAGGR